MYEASSYYPNTPLNLHDFTRFTRFTCAGIGEREHLEALNITYACIYIACMYVSGIGEREHLDALNITT